MNRIRSLLLVLALAGMQACFKPPEIVMVDRATALEQQASGSFDNLEAKLDRAAIEPRPVPLTPQQLEALGYRPAPLVDESDLTDADRLDAFLARHCVGEGKDGSLVDTRDACKGIRHPRGARGPRRAGQPLTPRGLALDARAAADGARSGACAGLARPPPERGLRRMGRRERWQVASQGVLTRRASAFARLALAGSLLAAHALADNVDDDDLVRPQRLTVDVADNLLGQLGPDGKTLYFVSNRDTTNQIFAQSMVDGRSHPLFDDGADVTWPRVSPDGRSLLYISFRESASGQLCIRSLPAGDGRRCLQVSSAALQAEWIDNRRIALVSRQSIEGDLSVVEVTIDPDFSTRPLLDRNVTSPTASPDGRWLVYVPVTRTEQAVGPAFAAHASQALEAVPIASARTTRPIRIAINLPGQTGQPAFSRDGRALYVVQFFSDTNRDGAIDASNHGVLFRVPISFDGPTPVVGTPEQLTETSWNCEYPMPFVDRVVATCSKEASLDVYSLPLDGEVLGLGHSRSWPTRLTMQIRNRKNSSSSAVASHARPRRVDAALRCSR